MGDVGVNIDDFVTFAKSVGSATPVAGCGSFGISRDEVIVTTLKEIVSVCRGKLLNKARCYFHC